MLRIEGLGFGVQTCHVAVDRREARELPPLLQLGKLQRHGLWQHALGNDAPEGRGGGPEEASGEKEARGEEEANALERRCHSSHTCSFSRVRAWHMCHVSDCS